MSSVRYHMNLRFVLPVFVGLLLLAGGCSAGSPQADKPEAASDAGADQFQTSQLKGEAPTAPEGVKATSAPVDGRSLIYRAEITVKVENVEQSADALLGLATTAGGFVASEKRQINSKRAHATVTVRVPAKQFQATLEKIADLGTEQSRGSNVEDVTEAIVDLDTRIAAGKASVESVRKMFERAEKLQDVVLLEKELSQRQSELAALEAKKRRLDDLVALSTITVTLVGPNTEIEVEEEPDPSFLGGLKAGWKAFVAAVEVASAVLGFLLPFLLAIAIPVIGLIYFLRYRRNRPAPPAD